MPPSLIRQKLPPSAWPSAGPEAGAPHRLLSGMSDVSGLHVLEARGPEGWGTGPVTDGVGMSLLAAEPVIEFAGGRAALQEARRWLDGHGGGPAEAAWLIGALSYELGGEFDPAAPRCSDAAVPAVSLAGFRAVYRWDGTRAEGEVVGSDSLAVRALAERVRAAAEVAPSFGRLEPSPIRSSTSDADFLGAVRSIQDWIRAGDVYQVNLSRRLDSAAPPRESLRGLYATLARRANAPFSAYLETGEQIVLSSSPERFLRVEQDHVETCPIKGTRPRGRSRQEDEWLAKELKNSPKDRAEHVMIVDLARNDLGRVCHTGSVNVARLAELRGYASVHHLVSSIEGRLRAPEDWPGLLAATFPGGSITGAPKLRAMQIIDELEPVERGVYTGAIGYIDAAGGIDLSIAIRTAVAHRGRLHLHLGGGIVADSVAEAELQETRDKGRDFARLWGLEG